MYAKRWATLLLTILLLATPARAEKIRDVATVLGAEPITVEGMGIVIGLNGTGDKAALTRNLFAAYLEKQQISLDANDLQNLNVALVHVDAQVPPFARPGQKLSVRVKAVDATSLEGGVLVMTALSPRPGGPVYAYAQGRVLIGNAELHATTGLIPASSNGGAQLLRSIPTRVVEDDGKFRLVLKNPSFRDADAIEKAINSKDSLNPYRQQAIGFALETTSRKIAWAQDAGQVIIQIPPSKLREQTAFIGEVLSTSVDLESPARVVFNRQTQTVIITGDVQYDPVAVSHANRFVTLTDPQRQPGQPLARREYRLEPNTERRLVDLDGHRQSLPNLEDMINTLNAMGTNPDDIIAILRQMKAAGAIHAELIVE